MFSGISSYIWGGNDDGQRNDKQREESPEVQETAIPAAEPGTDEWILIDVNEKNKTTSDSSSSVPKCTTTAKDGQKKAQTKGQGSKKGHHRSVSDKPILVPNLRFVSTQKRIKSRKVKSSKDDEFVDVATIPVTSSSSSDAPMSTASSSDNDVKPSYAAMTKVAKTKEEEKDKNAVSVFQELKPLPRIVVKDLPLMKGKKTKRSPTERGNGLMEGSWFVTPPPCFTKPNTFSLAASPEEDSLIEHPSLSGSINSPMNNYANYGSNNLSSNSSTPLISSPQDSPMTISTNSSPNHSPPVSPMVINRNFELRKSKLALKNIEPLTAKNDPCPEGKVEKEIVQADIRALARRTLTLRSRSNRFAELEKQEEEVQPFSETTDQTLVSQPMVDPSPLVNQSLAEVFYGPENKCENDETDSIDTTESLVTDHSDDENIDSDILELDMLSRPILAENLSSLNIVSRMEHKGRGRNKKSSKGRKGLKREKENGENEEEVTKRSSSSERAHAGKLSYQLSIYYLLLLAYYFACEHMFLCFVLISL